MSDKQPAREPEPTDEEASDTQRTEQGYEIPVPSREDFFGNLDKITKPDKS